MVGSIIRNYHYDRLEHNLGGSLEAAFVAGSQEDNHSSQQDDFFSWLAI
jgi:hypothetical protein